MTHKLRIAAAALTFLVSLIFCIKQIGEPDIWWQLATGEYIIDHGEVPKQDVFSFTHAETEWINVKWGTEVLMALVARWLGVENLMLLHWVFLLGICAALLGMVKRLRQLYGDTQPGLFDAGPLLALLPLFCAMSFRLNARPEMVSHLFTALLLWLFIDYRYRPTKRIFFMIPLMLLWANMHEAFGVGTVLMLIYTVLSWLEPKIAKSQHKTFTSKDLKQLSLASFLGILATGFHPMGFGMILHPFNIYGQLGDNKFTTELFGFQHAEYWHFPSVVGLLMLVLAAWFILKKGISWKERSSPFGLGILTIFAAIAFLSLQAYRNIPFLAIITFPFVALWFHHNIKNKVGYILTIFTGTVLYAAIGSGWFYKQYLPREKFGLRVDPSRNPIGGAKYLERHAIGGKGYVDYLSSAYLIYELDDYKSYIDLRDLDIFSGTFMDNVLMSYQYPNRKTKSGKTLFALMEEADTFSYALLVNKPEFTPIHRYLNQNSSYKLVYTDLVCSIYLKNNLENQQHIEASPKGFKNIFSPLSSVPTSGLALGISKVLWPTYSETDYSSIPYYNAKRALKQQLLGR